MATKADKLTQSRKKKEYYSDFLDSFFAAPTTGSLAKVINENSVKQSIKNLILTNIGERLYQPNIGSDVLKSLFEPDDLLTNTIIKNGIETTINYYEKRAELISVDVDSDPDRNELRISVVFSVINNPEPIDLTLNLKRVR